MLTSLLYILLCAFACVITSHLLSGSTSDGTTKRSKNLLTFSAALVFSVSTWSSYILSMFLLLPRIQDSLTILNIFLSLVVSLTGAAAAFFTLTHKTCFKTPNILAAFILGADICSTNYIGFASVRRSAPPSLFYLDTCLAFLSATFFSFIFLRAQRKGKSWQQNLEPAFWLSCAVLCSQAIERAFVRSSYLPHPAQNGPGATEPYLLALVSISVSFAILAYALFATLLEQRHDRDTEMEIQRFQKLAEVTTECLLILDRDIVVETNNVLSSIIGLQRAALKSRSILPVLTPHSGTTLTAALHQTRDTPTSFELDVVLLTGKTLAFSCTLRAIEYNRSRMHVLAMRDLSLQRKQENHIRYLALHDPLTDLPNRALFHQRMEEALLEASLANTKFAVFYLDLDRFKRINDVLGHEAGDNLLVQVARRIQSHIRPCDTLGRFGGDEFVLLYRTPTNVETISDYASGLIKILNQPYLLNGQNVSAAASIGIAIHPEHGMEEKTLLRHADMALFRAKAEGRGNFLIFSPEVREAIERRNRFKDVLARGVREQAFHLHWSPIEDRKTGKTEGYEAILCWKHPENDHVPLTNFIDLADELGFAEQLVYILFRDACREACKWSTDLTLYISLNLEHLALLDLSQILKTAFAKSGFPSERLKINLYEARLRTRQGQALQAVETIEETFGVRFSFDDLRHAHTHWKQPGRPGPEPRPKGP